MKKVIHSLIPPYYAVIFTSLHTEYDKEYEETSRRMEELASLQEGFLGYESAREEIGITVSYWQDLDSIKKWKNNSEHLIAQKRGKEKWYSSYRIRIARVEREYGIE
jgi:heme-degrading monooxygenase HmoA